jgi:putative endonuclease
MKSYYVYILASKSRTLYTGVTNNLERRMVEHKRKLQRGFTARYNINRLVHFEVFDDVIDAIAREKQIKGWGRMKKIVLIEATNRDWKDLSEGWPGCDLTTASKSKGPVRDSSSRSDRDSE